MYNKDFFANLNPASHHCIMSDEEIFPFLSALAKVLDEQNNYSRTKNTKEDHTPVKRMARIPAPWIDRVIFNDRTTVILWADGEKTKATCREEDPYSKDTGIMVCTLKKIWGNRGFRRFMKAAEELSHEQKNREKQAEDVRDASQNK